MIKKLFQLFGLDVQRLDNANTIWGGLRRAKENWEINPDAIIDIGAAEGKWSLEAMKTYPQAQYTLFEPLPQRKTELEILSQQHANIHFMAKGVGEKEGEIPFFVTDDLDSSGVADNGSNAQKVIVPIISLDIALAGSPTKSYCLKLDTHGYELPILRGATETLKKTDLLIIESYGFYIAPDAVTFPELCLFLKDLGFRLVDIVDVVRRSSDNTFWQCDAFFLRDSHSVFKQNTYH